MKVGALFPCGNKAYWRCNRLDSRLLPKRPPTRFDVGRRGLWEGDEGYWVFVVLTVGEVIN